MAVPPVATQVAAGRDAALLQAAPSHTGLNH
jgi:hypothetical protein